MYINTLLWNIHFPQKFAFIMPEIYRYLTSQCVDSAQTLLFHTHIISISPPFHLKLTFNMMITAIDPKMCEWWWCQKIIQSEERREAIISFGGNNQRYIYLISSNFLELLFSALWTNMNQKVKKLQCIHWRHSKCKKFENPIRGFHQYQNSWNCSAWFAQYKYFGHFSDLKWITVISNDISSRHRVGKLRAKWCHVKFFFDPWENDFLDKNQEEQFFLRLCWDFCVIFKHFLAGFPCKERRQDITNSIVVLYTLYIYLNVRFYDYFF